MKLVFDGVSGIIGFHPKPCTLIYDGAEKSIRRKPTECSKSTT